MGFITVGKENSNEIKLHYEDHGEGKTVLLIHGYPFSGVAWEKQEARLLEEGHRVVTYDRRGFGLSSHPSIGHDYDTFARDLDTLINTLDLRDVTLVGHSMGTGEIARYLSTYGSDRIERAVFISPIPPFLLKTEDNNGADKKIFDEIKAAIVKDRYSYMMKFLKNFYNTEDTLGNQISEEKLRADFNLGVSSSPIAFYKCVDTWLTDFRKDLPKITVPSLVIQGDKDKILPFEITGAILAEEINARLIKIAGGSHGIPWTHADHITKALLIFLRENPSKEIPRQKEVGRDTRTHLH